MESLKRYLRYALPLLPVLWGVGWILFKSFPDYPPGNDGSLYLAMAKGFAQGTGYHDVTSPDPDAGTLQSPSCWPMVLSLYWRIPHVSLWDLRLANALVLCLTAVPAFFWLRLFLPALPALLIMMAFTSSWATAFLGNSFMTETIFIPILYAGMLLSHYGESRDGDPKRASAMRWAALILWAMSARTRVVGWCFWGTYMLLLGRRKEWPKVAAGAAMIAGWLWFEHRMAAGIHVRQYLDGMFTEKYPLLVSLGNGLRVIMTNLGANLWSWSTAGQGHALLPWFYYAHPMDKAKRIVCAILFLAVLYGLFLIWSRHRRVRPWILASLAACIPTFVIYLPSDAWRYMHPFLPFACLFLMTALGSVRWPFGKAAAAGSDAKGLAVADAGGGTEVARRTGWLIALGLILVFSQAMHTYQRDMTDDYIDQSDDFRALHDSIQASPVKPALILSPDHYYTYLRTGIPTMSDYGRQQFLKDVIPYLNDRETWAIRGSANAYYVEPWERAGVAFRQPPVLHVRHWELFKTSWEGK
jgi:hypothetical protein